MSKKQKVQMFRLEDRVLFEAGAVIQAAEAAAAENNAAEESSAAQDADQNSEATDGGSAEMAEAAVAAADPDMVSYAVSPVGGEEAKVLVVLNSSVADAETLLAGIDENCEVLQLKSGTDAMDAINDYLDAHSDTVYSALHIVSHGDEGFITLNGDKIDNSSLDPADWKNIGEHLSADADILIYGCDTANSEEGRALIQNIANLTGADVAASTDTTGAGGDWDLEYRAGLVETATIQPVEYGHTLDTITLTITSAEKADVDSTDLLFKDLSEVVSYASDATHDYIVEFDKDVFTAGNTKLTMSSAAKISIPGLNMSIDGHVDHDGDGVVDDGEMMILDGGAVWTADNAGAVTVTTTGVRHFELENNNVVLSLRNLVLQNGYSTGNGGSIVLDSTGTTYTGITLDVDNVQFLNNVTKDNSGGAIYSAVAANVINIKDALFDGNYAKSYGGAVYVAAKEQVAQVTVTIDDSVFTGNIANAGGALVLSGAGDSLLGVVTDTLFDSNKALSFGGAVAFDTTAWGAAAFYTRMQNLTVINNEAGLQGGGMLVTMNVSLTLVDSTIVGNKLTDANYASGGEYTWSDGKSKATVGGGGIFTGSAHVSHDNAQRQPFYMMHNIIVGNTDAKGNADDFVHGYERHAPGTTTVYVAGNIIGAYKLVSGKNSFSTVFPNYTNTDTITNVTAENIFGSSAYDTTAGKWVTTNGVLPVQEITDAALNAAVNVPDYINGSYLSGTHREHVYTLDGGTTWYNGTSAIYTGTVEQYHWTDALGGMRGKYVSDNYSTAGAVQYEAVYGWQQDGAGTVTASYSLAELNTALATVSGEYYVAVSEFGLNVSGTDAVSVTLNKAGDGTVLSGSISNANGSYVLNGMEFAGTMSVKDVHFNNALISGTAVVSAENILLTNTTVYGAGTITATAMDLISSSVVDSGKITVTGKLNLLNAIVMDTEVAAGTQVVRASILNGTRYDLTGTAVETNITAADIFGSAPVFAGLSVKTLDEGPHQNGSYGAYKNGTFSSAALYSEDGTTWKEMNGTDTVTAATDLTVISVDALGNKRLVTATGASMGAYSSITEGYSTVVTIAQDIVDRYDGYISFREAFENAQRDGAGGVVTFDAAAIRNNTGYGIVTTDGDYTVVDVTGVEAGYISALVLASGQTLTINGIDQNGVDQKIILSMTERTAAQRMFEIRNKSVLKLNNLKLWGSDTTRVALNEDYNGGGFAFVTGETSFYADHVTFAKMNITGESHAGGAIYGKGGSYIKVTNAIFENNTIEAGGLIFASHEKAVADFDNIIIRDNTGVQSGSRNPQIIHHQDGAFCTFTNITATNNHGFRTFYNATHSTLGAFFDNVYIADSTFTYNLIFNDASQQPKFYVSNFTVCDTTVTGVEAVFRTTCAYKDGATSYNDAVFTNVTVYNVTGNFHSVFWAQGAVSKVGDVSYLNPTDLLLHNVTVAGTRSSKATLAVVRVESSIHACSDTTAYSGNTVRIVNSIFADNKSTATNGVSYDILFTAPPTSVEASAATHGDVYLLNSILSGGYYQESGTEYGRITNVNNTSKIDTALTAEDIFGQSLADAWNSEKGLLEPNGLGWASHMGYADATLELTGTILKISFEGMEKAWFTTIVTEARGEKLSALFQRTNAYDAAGRARTGSAVVYETIGASVSPDTEIYSEVNSAADVAAVTVGGVIDSTTGERVITLRDALAYGVKFNETVTFDADVFSADSNIIYVGATLDITSSVSIENTTGKVIEVSVLTSGMSGVNKAFNVDPSAYRVFTIAGEGITVSISGLTLTGGYLGAGEGGVIHVSGEGATLNLTDVIVQRGAAKSGGGLYLALNTNANLLRTQFYMNGGYYVVNAEGQREAQAATGMAIWSGTVSLTIDDCLFLNQGFKADKGNVTQNTFYITNDTTVNRTLIVRDSVFHNNWTNNWTSLMSGGDKAALDFYIENTSFSTGADKDSQDNWYSDTVIGMNAKNFTMINCSIVNANLRYGFAVSVHASKSITLLNNSIIANTEESSTYGMTWFNVGNSVTFLAANNLFVMNEHTKPLTLLFAVSKPENIKFYNNVVYNAVYASYAGLGENSSCVSGCVWEDNIAYADSSAIFNEKTPLFIELSSVPELNNYKPVSFDPSALRINGAATAAGTLVARDAESGNVFLLQDKDNNTWLHVNGDGNAAFDPVANADWIISKDIHGNDRTGADHYVAGSVTVDVSSLDGKTADHKNNAITDRTVVTVETDTIDYFDGQISIREAIGYASDVQDDNDDKTVNFADTVNTVVVDSQLIFFGPVTVDGSRAGLPNVTIKVPVTYGEAVANGGTYANASDFRMMLISNTWTSGDHAVKFTNLTLQGGQDGVFLVRGQDGLRVSYAELILDGVIISNTYADHGAAIYVSTWRSYVTVDITIRNSIIENNAAAAYSRGKGTSFMISTHNARTTWTCSYDSTIDTGSSKVLVTVEDTIFRNNKNGGIAVYSGKFIGNNILFENNTGVMIHSFGTNGGANSVDYELNNITAINNTAAGNTESVFYFSGNADNFGKDPADGKIYTDVSYFGITLNNVFLANNTGYNSVIRAEFGNFTMLNCTVVNNNATYGLRFGSFDAKDANKVVNHYSHHLYAQILNSIILGHGTDIYIDAVRAFDMEYSFYATIGGKMDLYTSETPGTIDAAVFKGTNTQMADKDGKTPLQQIFESTDTIRRHDVNGVSQGYLRILTDAPVLNDLLTSYRIVREGVERKSTDGTDTITNLFNTYTNLYYQVNDQVNDGVWYGMDGVALTGNSLPEKAVTITQDLVGNAKGPDSAQNAAGAFNLAEKLSLVVDTDVDVINAFDYVTSLREAIAYGLARSKADSRPATIAFSDQLKTAGKNRINVTRWNDVDPTTGSAFMLVGSTAKLIIDGDVDGNGVGDIIVDISKSNGTDQEVARLFELDDGATLTLKNITLYGSASNADGSLYVATGTDADIPYGRDLTKYPVYIYTASAWAQADYFGGGSLIHASKSHVIADNVSFERTLVLNAGQSGVIQLTYNGASMVITNSTFKDNVSRASNSAVAFSFRGGAEKATLTNVEFINNQGHSLIRGTDYFDITANGLTFKDNTLSGSVIYAHGNLNGKIASVYLEGNTAASLLEQTAYTSHMHAVHFDNVTAVDNTFTSAVIKTSGTRGYYEISNSTFFNNKIGGSAMFHVLNNKATADTHRTDFVVYNSTIAGNTFTGSGSGPYYTFLVENAVAYTAEPSADGYATLTLLNNVIAGNTASNASATVYDIAALEKPHANLPSQSSDPYLYMWNNVYGTMSADAAYIKTSGGNLAGYTMLTAFGTETPVLTQSTIRVMTDTDGNTIYHEDGVTPYTVQSWTLPINSNGWQAYRGALVGKSGSAEENLTGVATRDSFYIYDPSVSSKWIDVLTGTVSSFTFTDSASAVYGLGTGYLVPVIAQNGVSRLPGAMEYMTPGAYALTLTHTPGLVVTTAKDSVDFTDGLISLEEAMMYADELGKSSGKTQTITFSGDVDWSTDSVIVVDHEFIITAGTHIVINGALTYNGTDQGSITIRVANTFKEALAAYAAANGKTLEDLIGADLSGLTLPDTYSANADYSALLAAISTHRIFTVNTGASLELSNMTLQGGNVTGNAGIIYLTGTASLKADHVVFDGAKVTNTFSTGRGAAIYSDSTGTVDITNSTFRYLGAEHYGAAIYIAQNSSNFFDKNVFFANYTGYGGTVYSNRAGSKIYITNSMFYENGCNQLAQAIQADGGGEIYLISSTMARPGAAGTPLLSGIRVNSNATLNIINSIVTGYSMAYVNSNVNFYSGIYSAFVAGCSGNVTADSATVNGIYSADVFGTNTYDGTTVAISADSIAATSGILAGMITSGEDAVKTATVYRYETATGKWLQIGGTGEYADTAAFQAAGGVLVDIAQNGVSRTGTMLQFNVGAYALTADNTGSGVVTTGDDVYNFFDGENSLREVVNTQVTVPVTFESDVTTATLDSDLEIGSAITMAPAHNVAISGKMNITSAGSLTASDTGALHVGTLNNSGTLYITNDKLTFGTLTNTGTIDVTGTLAGSGTLGGTVIYRDGTTINTGYTYGLLDIVDGASVSSTGTVTAATLSIGSGATLDAVSLDISAGFENAGLVMVSGNFDVDVAASGFGNVTYDGRNQTVATNAAYDTLTLTGGGTKTATGTLTANTLAISAADVTLDAESVDVTTMNNAGLVQVSGSLAADNKVYGNVTYDGADQTVAEGTYAALVIAGTGAEATTFEAASTAISSAASDLTVSGNFNGGELTNNGTLTLNGADNAFTAASGAGNVVYSGADQNIVAGVSYNDLTLSGSGTKTAAGDVTVSGALVNSVILALTGSLSVANGTNALGNVTYNGTGTQNVQAGTYSNLTLQKGSKVLSSTAGTVVSGTFTADAAAINSDTTGTKAALSLTNTTSSLTAPCTTVTDSSFTDVNVNSDGTMGSGMLYLDGSNAAADTLGIRLTGVVVTAEAISYGDTMGDIVITISTTNGKEISQGSVANMGWTWTVGNDAVKNVTTGTDYELTSAASSLYQFAGNVNVVINQRAITVTGTDAAVTYDGAEHTLAAATVTAGTLVGNQTLDSSTFTTKYINAGTYTDIAPASVVIKDADGNDMTANYAITFAGGTLTIDKAVITITATDASVTYDGMEHTLSAGTVTTGTLVAGQTLDSFSFTTKYINAGTYTDIAPASVVIKDAADNNVTANYDITFAGGTLTIDKAAITVTGVDKTVVYNAQEHKLDDATISGALVNGHTLASLDYGEGETKAWVYFKTVSDAVIHDAAGNDVTNNYEISYDRGILTINKAKITVTGDDLEVGYNGMEQTLKTATASGAELVSGHKVAAPAFSAGGTAIGTYTVDVYGAVILDSNNTAVTENYDITYASGKLTITAADLTVTGDDRTVTYDGTEYTLLSASGTGLLNGHSIKTVTIGAGGTDAGDYNVTVSAAAIVDADGNDVTGNYNISYVDGTLTIEQLAVTVTATDRTVTYNGAEQTLTDATLAGQVAGHTLNSWTFNTVATDVGSYDIAADTAVITDANGADVTDNYAITFAEGVLTIEQLGVTVTATDRTVTYNGAEQTLTDATLAGQVDGHTLNSWTITAGATDAGSHNIAADSAVITDATGADVTDNYAITFAEGVLTIEQLAVTVTATDRTVTYNGAEQTLTDATLAGQVDGHVLDSWTFTVGATDAGSHNIAADSAVITDATGADVTANYAITFAEGVLTIEQLAVTVTATDRTVTYNGAEQTLSEAALAGQVDGHSLSDWTFTANGTDVGSYAIGVDQAVIIDAAGADVTKNYIITYEGADLTIEQAELTISGIAAVGREYDGTTAVGLDYSNVVFGGICGDDQLTVSATGELDNADVGNGKAVAINGLTVSGDKIANYYLSDDSQAETTVDIAKRVVEVTALDAEIKTGDVPVLNYTYDANRLVGSDKFTGELSFTGEVDRNGKVQKAGEYEITLGTLAVTDNYDVQLVNTAYLTVVMAGGGLTTEQLSSPANPNISSGSFAINSEHHLAPSAGNLVNISSTSYTNPQDLSLLFSTEHRNVLDRGTSSLSDRINGDRSGLQIFHPESDLKDGETPITDSLGNLPDAVLPNLYDDEELHFRNWMTDGFDVNQIGSTQKADACMDEIDEALAEMMKLA